MKTWFRLCKTFIIYLILYAEYRTSINFFSMLQLCDPCFKAVKLQKQEFKKKLAATLDTDTPNTNPTSPTKDCSQMLSGAFFLLAVAILIGVFFHIITKDNFHSKFFSTNSTNISLDFFRRWL